MYIGNVTRRWAHAMLVTLFAGYSDKHDEVNYVKLKIYNRIAIVG